MSMHTQAEWKKYYRQEYEAEEKRLRALYSNEPARLNAKLARLRYRYYMP